jgi:hypothetical protein
VDAWLDRYRHFWTQHLDALGTEIARGRRARRAAQAADPPPGASAGEAPGDTRS